MSSIRKHRMKTKLAAIILVATAILVIAIMLLRTGKSGDVPTVSTPADLSSHPIYSEYEFGETDKIIDLGMQPLSLTLCIIAEAMKRDIVLNTALSGLGLEIRFHPFSKGSDVNYFLSHEKLDAAMAGDMPAIAAAAVSDVVIVAQNKLGFSSIVARKPIQSKDLKGKRIGYPLGSNAHHGILQALSSQGLEETDVHLVNLNVNEMPDALAQDKIDAFIAWEPTPTITLARSDDFAIIHRVLTSTYLYFSGSFASQHPEAVRHIIASQLRSIAWMKHDRQNLLEACGWALRARRDFTNKEQILSVDQYASLVRDHLLDFDNVSFIPEEDLAMGGRLFEGFGFLKDLGKIPSSSYWNNVHSSFNIKIVGEIVADPKKYRIDEYNYNIGGENHE